MFASRVALLAAGCIAVDGVRVARSKGNSGSDLVREVKNETWSHASLASLDYEQKNDRIICPVIAAMHRAGDLKSDPDGNVELQQIMDALEFALGNGHGSAAFQAYGISNFVESQKGIEQVRSRCLPNTVDGAKCWAARQVGSTAEWTKRYFNVYLMNGKQVMEHGISTGTRGGATNMPPGKDLCNGVYPCEAAFQKYYVANADKNGRFYMKNMMKIVCQARIDGDRGGEHSYGSGLIHLPGLGSFIPGLLPSREWQMKGAISATLATFGWRDSSNDLFLTVDDMRNLVMNGRYPDGWKMRKWGCLLYGCEFPTYDRFTQPVGECAVGDNDAWWPNSGCEVKTGKDCGWGCAKGSFCVDGQCICGRGKNGEGMCWNGSECAERNDACTYFGEKCVSVAATNPPAADHE